MTNSFPNPTPVIVWVVVVPATVPNWIIPPLGPDRQTLLKLKVILEPASPIVALASSRVPPLPGPSPAIVMVSVVVAVRRK